MTSLRCRIAPRTPSRPRSPCRSGQGSRAAGRMSLSRRGIVAGSLSSLSVLLTLACGEGSVEPPRQRPNPEDVAPPLVVVTTPPRRAVVADAGFSVKGSITDAGGVERATYQLNGGVPQPVSVVPGTSSAFELGVSLPVGQNVITVNAYDVAGNHASVVVEVRRTSTVFARVVPGFRHTCAITPAGSAFCWGDNETMQLGRAEPAGVLIPRPVAGAVDLRSLEST